MLYLEPKLEQSKLDGRLSNLPYHKNGKIFFFHQGQAGSGKVLQLFLEAQEDRLR